jgi:outer membrane protein assembly factor BamB
LRQDRDGCRNCIRVAAIVAALMWCENVLFAFEGGPDAGIPWTQFRGSGGQGDGGTASLPTSWSETHGLIWKTAIPGLGHSSPVHDGSTIWLTTATSEGKSLEAIAIDPVNGAIRHRIPLFSPGNIEPIHSQNSYASPTAVLAPARLYVHFGTYGTAGIDTGSLQVLWRNTDYTLSHEGGPGSSPVLFEDLLILTLDGADTQRVIALDANNGKLRWQRKRSSPMQIHPSAHRAFATPLIIENEGRPLLISPAANQCHAYDPRTGEELWHVRYEGFSNVPRPVANATECFITTGFFHPEFWAVSLSGHGDVTETHVKWKFKGSNVPETPSPLLIGDKLYFISNKGILTVLDTKTGKRAWGMRVGGNYSSSPLSAGGLIYFCSEEGIVKVLDPRLAKPKLIEINELDGRIMSSPAVIQHDLLIRTDTSLYRLGRK